jgi:Glycosyltransferase family 87
VSGLLNPTVWVVAGALIAVLASRRQPAEVLGRYANALARPAVLSVLALLAGGHLTARIALGVAAPGDFLGEIVAARSLSRGAGLYSPSLAEETRTTATTHDGWAARTIAPYLPPALKARAALRERYSIVAQAHPPTLLAPLAFLITLTNAEAIYLLVALLSVAAAIWTGRALRRTLWPDHPARVDCLLAVLLCGWQPTLAAVRDGQISVILAALVVASWIALRARSEYPAGALLGTATALKFYPALFLLPTVLRSRKAVLAAALAISGWVTVSLALTGVGAWIAYAESAKTVVALHGRSLTNLSLLARCTQVTSWPVARTLFVVASIGLVGWLFVADLRNRRSQGSPSDADCAFARTSCVATLVSPLVWHHYVFLLVQPLAVIGRYALPAASKGFAVAALVVALLLSLPVTETVEWRTQALAGPWIADLLSRTTAILALLVLTASVRTTSSPLDIPS